MSKKLLIIIISAVVAVVATVSIILAVVFSKPKEQNNNNNQFLDSARTIKVVQVEGSASVTDDEGTTSCFKGMNLYNGDKVNVNADSVLVIKFDEDKYTYLGENTIISIKSEGKDKYKTNIFVEQGKVLAEIQKPLGVDEEFFLSSNNSVMAVRGTIFGVTVLKTADEVKQTYSVYKGVTELYVFDKVNNEVVKGKLSDISNQKIEVVVPNENLMTQDEYKQITDNWMKDISKTFDDPTDANENLDEVNITVGVPSEDDYKEVTETIGGSGVTYSEIKYSASGYIGQYDGKPHKINIKVDTPNAKVEYKGEGETAYKDTNDYEFTNVGTYRVYYRITCEGYDAKEDYEVIQITKADIGIMQTGKISIDSALSNALFVAGAPIKTFTDMASISLGEFYSVVLVEADASQNYSFDLSQEVVKGTNSYKVAVKLPDSIKDNYNDAYVYLNITASELSFASSDAIINNALDISEISTFNKYNGVKVEELFTNTLIKDSSNSLSSQYSYSFDYEYDYITEGFYELKDINTINLKVNLAKSQAAGPSFSVTIPVTFSYVDSRSETTLSLTPTCTELAEDNYCIELSDTGGSRYTLTGAEIKRYLGISSNRASEIHLNPDAPYDIATEANNLLTDDVQFSFDKDKVSILEFVIFASSDYKSLTKKVFVYFTDVVPTTYPTYTISDNLVFKYSAAGTTISFVESTSPVVYSLDGTTYTENLVINETGTYKVYFKVGSDIVIEDYREIKVEKGQISSDNLDMIKSTINILSNDGNSLTYGWDSGEYMGTADVQSYDGSPITSLDTVFEVYSNMLENSVYYDSVSKQVLDATVTVTRNANSRLVFDYKVEAENYEPLIGTIEFNYSQFGDQSYVSNGQGIIISNPSDVQIKQSLIDIVSATPVSISLEDSSDVVTSGLYSVDGGKTWTTEPPVVSGVGVHYVYVIYDVRDAYYNTPDPMKYPQKSSLSRDGNYIIAIQKIEILAD